MKLRPLVAAVARAIRGMECPAAGDTLVVGVSGGADSTALLDVLASLAPRRGFRVVAAHLDHGLRPDSAADAQACAELAERLGLSFQVGRADVAGRARRLHESLEDAARRERYAFLRDVMGREGACAIAVAHTRDDQAETVLLRLLRGSGASGLAAMRERSRDVVRPLLQVSRGDVLAHLRSRGLAWRDDPTNADASYALRNRVRLELLPALRSFNPSIVRTLARTAAVLADEADLVEDAGRELLARIGRTEDGGVALDRMALARAPRAAAQAAVREALELAGGRKGVGAVHVSRLLALAAARRSSGRRLPLPGGREAIVEFDALRIGPRRAPAAPFTVPLDVPGQAEAPGGPSVLARAAHGPVRSGRDHAVVAVDDRARLVLRTRQPGDRVYEGGRRVSLKKFLIEQRVPVSARPGLPLVASGHDVVFVPGLVVDSPPGERFVSLEVRA